MSTLLNGNFKIQIFGESHSESIGAVVEGFPAGLTVDTEALGRRMAARRASAAAHSTKRIEPDEVLLESGVFEGHTTGAALCLRIRNTNVRSSDYEDFRSIPRPSHADWPAHVRYGGFEDYRGGGQFSGRLTAPVVAVGALCAQWLSARGVTASARIRSIAGVEAEDKSLSEETWARMLAEIERAAADKSSCGGVVEGRIAGLPAGLGGTMADSVESRLASLLYAVPAVKGVSFGLGFGFAAASGKDVNDAYAVRDGKVVTKTNYNGGVLGGITTGADVVFSAAFKPVPSIAAEQDSVDLARMEPAKLRVKGRHDVCIVPRAVPVVEAVAAIAATDLLLEGLR